MNDRLNVKKKTTGDTLNLWVEGEINTNTVKDFEVHLGDNLVEIEHLIIDLEKLVFISSAGLRALLSAAKIMDAKKGTMVVKNPQPSVQEVFDITGFSGILNIEPVK